MTQDQLATIVKLIFNQYLENVTDEDQMRSMVIEGLAGCATEIDAEVFDDNGVELIREVLDFLDPEVE